MRILPLGNSVRPLSYIRTSQSPPRFGSDADDAFFSIVNSMGGSASADKTREAELNQYIGHLQGVLDELNEKSPMWEDRKPAGEQLQTSGLRLREEAQREEAPDEFKAAVATLFVDCAEEILDPLKSPADVENAVEEALRELKEEIAVHFFQKELEAF
jgi:hypothetical protein